MKKTILITILSIALFVLFGCAQTSEKTTQIPMNPALERILKNGELVVGMTANMPPMSMQTKSGELIGYDIDLARHIAKAMGVELRLQTMPFSELLPALESSEIDMIISGMTITPERNLKVAFVGPYLASGKCILTKLDSLAKAEDASEVKAKNKTFAVLKGSTSEAFVENSITEVQIVPTENYDEAINLVLKDEVDALVADYSLCSVTILRYPSAGLASIFTLLTYEPLGIAIPANNPLLENWLSNLLITFEGAGRLEELRMRWFEDAKWLRRLE